MIKVKSLYKDSPLHHHHTATFFNHHFSVSYVMTSSKSPQRLLLILGLMAQPEMLARRQNGSRARQQKAGGASLGSTAWLVLSLLF